jgi:hypothetical protein
MPSYIYTSYVLHYITRLVREKIETAVNAMCQENLACHSGHSSLTFASSALRDWALFIHEAPKYSEIMFIPYTFSFPAVTS